MRASASRLAQCPVLTLYPARLHPRVKSYYPTVGYNRPACLSIRAFKDNCQEDRDDDAAYVNSMQIRRTQSGAQEARLADHVIQAPLEPRGVVANLVDKLRVCTALAKGTYSHLGTGAAHV
jgi:hypothetical protein